MWRSKSAGVLAIWLFPLKARLNFSTGLKIQAKHEPEPEAGLNSGQAAAEIDNSVYSDLLMLSTLCGLLQKRTMSQFKTYWHRSRFTSCWLAQFTILKKYKDAEKRILLHRS